jgi:hypothetical protein
MPGPSNSINESTTGICGFTSTAFVGSPATQHAVQIGGATTSTLASVALGSSGQVLTSNGAGVAPTFQSIPSSFAPNSTVQLVDDFFKAAPSSSVLTSELTWTVDSAHWTNAVGVDSTNAHPGVIGNSSMASLSRPIMLGAGTTSAVAGFKLGGGELTINWVFSIVTASNGTNRYTLVCGIGDTSNAAAQANGCWVQYSDNLNSGNWTFNTSSASTPTNSNSSTAVTTGWHNAQIVVNAAGTSVQFNMDGVSLGTAITTNIPTTGILPFFNIVHGAGTVAAVTVLVDLFYLRQTLTATR